MNGNQLFSNILGDDTLFVTSAYNRRYKSLDAALKDWVAGKDFKIYGGPYLSIRDVNAVQADGYNKIRFVDNTLGSVELFKAPVV